MAKAKLLTAAPADRRARTHERILAAATALIGRDGYDRMSMEDVARDASVTRRTIYSHFTNKDELIVAAARRRAPPIAPTPRKGVSLKQHMRDVGKAVIAEIGARRPDAIHAASFQLYALTHEELRVAAARESAEIYAVIERAMLLYWRPKDFPMPVGHFVRVIHALTEGLLARRFLTPAEFSDDLIIGAFESLV